MPQVTMAVHTEGINELKEKIRPLKLGEKMNLGAIAPVDSLQPGDVAILVVPPRFLLKGRLIPLCGSNLQRSAGS